MTTIHDVARRLNLSITTVSRALDGYDDVAEETRRRVVQVAKEMGYTPNRSARQLRRQRAETIGYILPASTPRFNDPFYSEFIAGLGNEASLHNFDLLVSTAPPGDESEKQLYEKWVQGRKVDGLILNRTHLNDWRVLYLAEHKFPFVCLERSQDPVDYGSIEVDGQAGMLALVEHLVAQGHTRIGYCGGSHYLSLQASRFAGYAQGLERAGLPFDPRLVTEGDMTRQAGQLAGQSLLTMDEPPTAITCVNDLTAIGVLHAARDLGLVVGRDLALAGFDGIEDTEHTQPPLTTLAQPLYDLARRLVMMLLAEISGGELLERQVRIQPELLIRASTQG